MPTTTTYLVPGDLDPLLVRLSACESRLSALEHPAPPVPIPDPVPVPDPLPDPEPEPAPQPAGDLATVTTANGTVWTLAADGRVLADGQPFDNWTWGSGPDFRAVAFRQDAAGTYARRADGTWFAWAGVTWPLTHVDAEGQPQPVSVVTAPPGGGSAPPPPQTEAPTASPDGTVVDQPWQPITGFDGVTLVLSDTKGTKDGGAHYIGYETGRVYDEQIPGLVETTPQTPATEDGSARPPRWVPFGEKWAFIAGERYGYCWKIAYKNGSIYQYAKEQWYGPKGIVPDPFAPPYVPPARTVGSRPLTGGWRLQAGLAHCNLAIDFDRMKAWISTKYENPGDLLEFDLPPMGQGSDVSVWPVLSPDRIIPEFWSARFRWYSEEEIAAVDALEQNRMRSLNDSRYRAYASGLYYGDLTGSGKKLWCAPKVYYDTFPPLTTMLVAEDGEVVTVPVPRQKFAGFVKRGPGLKPYIGSGGDESGQGGACGPTCATLDGQVLVNYERPDMPGAEDANGVPMYWNQRAPRDPNYSTVYHGDSWIGWYPRVINGVLEGRWASDRVSGGGLVLPEGIAHWARMGTGVIDYGNQSPTFTWPVFRRTYRYLHDAVTGACTSYDLTGLGHVTGQELGPDGTVYLLETDAWSSTGDPERCDAPMIAVFA